MFDGLPIHIGIPTADLACPSRGSVRMHCAGCGMEMWIDPMTCKEIPEGLMHEHKCAPCIAPEMLSGQTLTAITPGSWARAMEEIARRRTARDN